MVIARSWVLVANSSYAQILEYHMHNGIPDEFSLVKRLEHPAGRTQNRDLVTDRPGLYKGSDSEKRAIFGENSDIHKHEIDVFSHELIDFLTKARDEHKFNSLSIIAPPQMLGCLRNIMGPKFKDHIKKEVPKNLPEFINNKELHEHISTYLQEAPVEKQ
ncbi:MAG: host attachment protein [Oligoflexia bacterium]|nr:host attachment protein [Oligoflexia bacterium]